MPKMKTKKALAKRFRKSSKGRIKHACASRGHLLSGKSGNRKRHLRKGGVLAASEEKRIRHLF
ncbi:MAG: 50S ribosomal protein L35 [Lentisphaerae bacterium]|nr:50S ribosomal protein L35 [Lentisphaerota bacterium]